MPDDEPKAMSADHWKAVQAVLDSRPDLLSALYDLGLLPEQWLARMDAAAASARKAALEEAALLIDRRSEEVLAKQTGEQYPGFNAAVDTQLRMSVVVLPELSAAIRALAAQQEGE